MGTQPKITGQRHLTRQPITANRHHRGAPLPICAHTAHALAALQNRLIDPKPMNPNDKQQKTKDGTQPALSQVNGMSRLRHS